MSSIISEEDFKSARYLHGSPDDFTGVLVTKSNILVKYGPWVDGFREKAAIDFVREHCPQIPVPEVFDAWDTLSKNGKRRGCIAMSYLPGDTLKDVWSGLSDADKGTILQDFEAILGHFRSIPRPKDCKIGFVDGKGAADTRGSKTEESGSPFANEKDYNYWLMSLIHEDSTTFHGSFYIDTLRHVLAESAYHRILFTHEDLGMHNILVEDGRITGVIDWEYAGWYPEYVEYMKMIQFTRDAKFRSWARECWTDEYGMKMNYDRQYVNDQLLDSQILHGERVIKRVRFDAG